MLFTYLYEMKVIFQTAFSYMPCFLNVNRDVWTTIGSSTNKK